MTSTTERRPQDAATAEPAPPLTIAATAERTGVPVHTLRYYERIGLLAVARNAAGHREYSADDVARVVFLSRLRRTGMPIREIQRYVHLVGDGPGTVAERLALLHAHREAVRTQLAGLQATLETIEFKIAAYGGECRP